MEGENIILFDDGFKPSTFKNTDESNKIYINSKTMSNFINVYENVLTNPWREFSYDYAIKRKKPWGVYVLVTEILNETINLDEMKQTNPMKAIALVATRSLFFEKALDVIRNDIKIIHGISVWCLSSSENHMVDYHIDYAELYRYENNIICPPLFAGTCHISPLTVKEIEGGDFFVNSGGLSHYAKYGYKGNLSGVEELENDIKFSKDWTTVKYNCNTGIVHDGDFPHFSSKITRLPDNTKRVILGFNCFSEEISECNMRAPEHSDAFNRTIKLYQTMTSLNSTTNDNRDIRKDDILKNRSLCKLLVLAAKKVKNNTYVALKN